MFLNASPQDAFRAAEITAQNAAEPEGSRQTFRASEIVAQNATATGSKLPRMIMAGVGVFLLYNVLKGKK